MGVYQSCLSANGYPKRMIKPGGGPGRGGYASDLEDLGLDPGVVTRMRKVCWPLEPEGAGERLKRLPGPFLVRMFITGGTGDADWADHVTSMLLRALGYVDD